MRENSGKLDTASNMVWNGGSSTTPSVQGISSNTNTFFDKTPGLLKVLDKVGEIHPFAGSQYSRTLVRLSCSPVVL